MDLLGGPTSNRRLFLSRAREAGKAWDERGRGKTTVGSVRGREVSTEERQ
jgi:hypothetical protein